MYWLCTGASSSTKSGCCKQFGLRGKCKSERPSVWMCWGNFVPAESSFAATNAAGGGSGGDTVHPDATRAYHLTTHHPHRSSS